MLGLAVGERSITERRYLVWSWHPPVHNGVERADIQTRWDPLTSSKNAIISNEGLSITAPFVTVGAYGTVVARRGIVVYSLRLGEMKADTRIGFCAGAGKWYSVERGGRAVYTAKNQVGQWGGVSFFFLFFPVGAGLAHQFSFNCTDSAQRVLWQPTSLWLHNLPSLGPHQQRRHGKNAHLWLERRVEQRAVVQGLAARCVSLVRAARRQRASDFDWRRVSGCA